MKAARIIPLLVINMKERIFYYSTYNASVAAFDMRPISDAATDDHIFTTFKNYMSNTPSVEFGFDPLNPRLVISSIKIALNNFDGLHHYSHLFPLESADCILVMYDIVNKIEMFRFVGKMAEVSYTRSAFEFSIKDGVESMFLDQPLATLAKDTFQTVHTFGPFDTNPLSNFGLLVDVCNRTDPNTVPATAMLTTWPVSLNSADKARSLVTFIEHPTLYNVEDDLFWIGSLVGIIEDPFGQEDYEERSDVNRNTGALVAGSPYTDWPTSALAPPPGHPVAVEPLKSCFALGAVAYVLRMGGGDYNAKYEEDDW